MNTKKLKQLVLDLAIHGKLVPQDPNDEPASELLKRIQADVETHGRASNKSKGKKSAVSSVDFDEVPFEVPEGWMWCRLVTICGKLVDGDHNPPSGEKSPTPYLMASSKNIYNDRLVDLDDVRFLTEDRFIECDKRTRVSIGDLAITSVGTLGRTCIIKENLNITFQRSVTVVSALGVYNYYLKYCIDSPYIQKIMVENSRGTAQQGFYINQMADLLIPIPPLAEQHRIVAAIEKWFAVIDQLEKNEADLKKSIEQTKKKVLDLAIRGKLVESEGEWEEKRLGDVAEYINGRAFKPEEWEISGMPIIRIQNLNDESAKYNYTSQRFEDKYIVNRGDLLFAWAASLGTYIWKGEDAWLNQHIFKVVPRDFISKRFLHIVLDALISDFYTQSHGSGMVHITRKSFENIKIPVPSLAEQKRIVEKIEEVMGVLERIEGMI